MSKTVTPTQRVSGDEPAGLKKRRRSASIQPYLYLAPAAIFLLLVFAYPFVEIVRSSLQVPSVTGTPTFGLTNYKFLLGDPVFK